MALEFFNPLLELQVILFLDDAFKRRQRILLLSLHGIEMMLKRRVNEFEA
jgi:hypothetical protein